MEVSGQHTCLNQHARCDATNSVANNNKLLGLTNFKHYIPVSFNFCFTAPILQEWWFCYTVESVTIPVF